MRSIGPIGNRVVQYFYDDESTNLFDQWTALWLIGKTVQAAVSVPRTGPINTGFPLLLVTDDINMLSGRLQDRVPYNYKQSNTVDAYKGNGMLVVSCDWFGSRIVRSKQHNADIGRIVCAHSSKPRKLIPWQPDAATPLDNILGQVDTDIDLLSLDGPAVSRYSNWYTRRRPGTYDWLRAFTSYEAKHVLRAAGIIAISYSTTVITAQHIDVAISLVSAAKYSINSLLTSAELSDRAVAGIDKLLKLLATDDVPMTDTHVHRYCAPHMHEKVTTAALNVLWQGGIITKYVDDNDEIHWKLVNADKVAEYADILIAELESQQLIS